jgi:hypothetical protein
VCVVPYTASSMASRKIVLPPDAISLSTGKLESQQALFSSAILNRMTMPCFCYGLNKREWCDAQLCGCGHARRCERPASSDIITFAPSIIQIGEVSRATRSFARYLLTSKRRDCAPRCCLAATGKGGKKRGGAVNLFSGELLFASRIQGLSKRMESVCKLWM